MDLTRERYQALKDLLGSPANERNPIDKNNNATFPCLFCHHHKPKMTINLETEVYNCWVCQQRGMGILNLMKKINVPIPQNYVRYFRKNYYNIDIENLFGDKPKQEEYKNQLSIPKGYHPLYISKNNILYRGGTTYLLNRGLKEDDFIRYDIQYSPSERRVLFPSYNSNNELNYYLSRAIYNTDFRYKNARVSKDNIIFNEHLVKWDQDVYIVEGVFDAIMLDAVAILGSEINAKQKQQIDALNRKVIIVPDRDRAGSKLIDQACDWGWSVSMPPWHEGIKDINNAVLKYGRALTMQAILKHTHDSRTKIKLNEKLWI